MQFGYIRRKGVAIGGLAEEKFFWSINGNTVYEKAIEFALSSKITINCSLTDCTYRICDGKMLWFLEGSCVETIRIRYLFFFTDHIEVFSFDRFYYLPPINYLYEDECSDFIYMGFDRGGVNLIKHEPIQIGILKPYWLEKQKMKL